MRILLTGGSGFLGSALARQLHAGGHTLSLLLRPRSSLARLGDAAAGMAIGRCASDGDILAFVAAQRPDVVLHTACCYGRQGETALQLLDANLRLGVLLLQALQAVHAGTAQRGLLVHAASALPPGANAYALSKAQFADWGRAGALAGGPRFLNLLLQHMYGPGDDAGKFSTQVLRACRSHQPVLALTAGTQRRDFIHVDDVVGAIDWLLQPAVQARLADADALDLGSGEAPTVRHFVETVHALTASRTRLDFGAIPYRPNEAMHCQADLTRLRSLGWTPRLGLREGLQQTLRAETPPCETLP
ncbi:MAG TPA: NAD(P)-dependent oxidoreductase [Aquabacterium sp.]|nr:NAD(P)-dependent oxidoreductase [Aquabacterium sp.]HQC94539.1 NAD(P)-dependent oxidoreductase [Aquabacterium sp.]